MTEKKIGAAIIGGSGYGAGELLRLLSVHPFCAVRSVISRSQYGKNVREAHPHLAGFYDLRFESELKTHELEPFETAVVFFALPHGVSARAIEEFIERNRHPRLRIVDLSGDFRLSNPEMHKEFYPESPLYAGLRSRFCYGLPELFREKIKSSDYIANPGCYATACLLAVAPLIGKVSADVFFDAKSGSSGAGRAPSADTHHPALHANAAAYKVLSHRHEPEIQQNLGEDLKCTFVPHLIPVSRGIYATAHLRFAEAVDLEEMRKLYSSFYSNASFVRVGCNPPQLANVVCSNYCDTFITVRGNRGVAMAAIDNLVKGMAGQAVQNMNLMCGLPEDTGLNFPPPGIV